MKKLFIGLVVLSVIGVTSCQKNHTCACLFIYKDGSVVEGKGSSFNDSKKQAKVRCEAKSESNTDVTLKCELK